MVSSGHVSASRRSRSTRSGGHHPARTRSGRRAVDTWTGARRARSVRLGPTHRRFSRRRQSERPRGLRHCGLPARRCRFARVSCAVAPRGEGRPARDATSRVGVGIPSILGRQVRVSARAGSSRDARYAGTQPASTPTTVIVTAAPPKTTGGPGARRRTKSTPPSVTSTGRIPDRRPPRPRVAAHARGPARPVGCVCSRARREPRVRAQSRDLVRRHATQSESREQQGEQTTESRQAGHLVIPREREVHDARAGEERHPHIGIDALERGRQAAAQAFWRSGLRAHGDEGSRHEERLQRLLRHGQVDDGTDRLADGLVHGVADDADDRLGVERELAVGNLECHRERPSHRVPTGKEPFHERFVADHDRLGASPVAFLDGAPARTGMPYASNHPGEIGPVGDSRPPSRAARRTVATASEHGPRLRLAPRLTPSIDSAAGASTMRAAPRICRHLHLDRTHRAAHRQAWRPVRTPGVGREALFFWAEARRTAIPYAIDAWTVSDPAGRSFRVRRRHPWSQK